MTLTLLLIAILAALHQKRRRTKSEKQCRALKSENKRLQNEADATTRARATLWSGVTSAPAPFAFPAPGQTEAEKN